MFVTLRVSWLIDWIPAFAGMTDYALKMKYTAPIRHSAAYR